MNKTIINGIDLNNIFSKEKQMVKLFLKPTI